MFLTNKDGDVRKPCMIGNLEFITSITGIYGGDIVGLRINFELGPSSCTTYTWLIGDEASINEI